MTTTEHDLRREAIRRTLAPAAGDAGAVAESTLRTWALIALRLAPVIGARGVDALFGRALHVASKQFPWLAMAGHDGDGAARLSDLGTRLAGREADVALAAGQSLLTTFSELLASLIGESLTDRLLTPVWVPLTSNPAPSPTSGQENER